MRPLLSDIAKLKDVRLIDAHSYCWILAHFLKLEAEGKLESARAAAGGGRKYGGREICVVEMRQTVEHTAKYSNGQIIDRTVKNKEKRMSSQQLEQLIFRLLDIQENRCALSGIPFDFGGTDKALMPSVDRIDSDGHYEDGNLQIVCRFINGWKSDSGDEEFRRLLNLVRGDHERQPPAISWGSNGGRDSVGAASNLHDRAN